MRYGEDGRLYAINPEFGFFGVAPGTNTQSNPIAIDTIKNNTLFTNVALTKEGDVWWEDLTKEPPANLTDWKGNPNWSPSEHTPRAAHPNSRFCVPISNCSNLDPSWDDPRGVPIDAIIFGGRRGTTVPLVYESFDWKHGVFMGASISSETTAANVGARGALRHDPFAMLPFCGYHMGDYFNHWLKMGKRGKSIPKIFGVNWFRRDDKGFLWPGFGENSRVLKWIFERCDDSVKAEKTEIGLMPKLSDIDTTGLKISPQTLKTLLSVDKNNWSAEASSLKDFFKKFGKKLPNELNVELDNLEKRLNQ